MKNGKLLHASYQLIRLAKLKQVLTVICFLTSFCCGAQFHVRYKNASNDSLPVTTLLLKDSFWRKLEADNYISKLPSLLQSQGYLSASIDSIRYVDSTSVLLTLFLGNQYHWTTIKTVPEDASLLEAVHWPENNFKGTMNFDLLRQWQQKIIDYLEENGHPFGKVYLDSVGLAGDNIDAVLKIEPGPVYKIDSIRIYGDAKVSSEFLQRWLNIYNGSIYNSKKLKNVSKRLTELAYVQQEHAPTVDYLATGSVLNVYLKARKNNQVNALIGLLPNSNTAPGENKFLLTVDANILLRNSLGSGETIGFIWQRLQQKSPRLNLLYEQPFIFKSPFGLNFNLDMYKKDSAFLNINMNLGTSYRIEEKQTASVFLQWRQTIVSLINEGAVISSRQLPREADVSSLNLGVGYTFNNTDYRFNPRKGNEFSVTTSAGTKKVKKSNLVLDLKDPSDPSFDFGHLYDTVKLKAYQFRVTTTAAHYFPLGGQSLVKLGVGAGIYSSANYFRNELFQIGGFRLLRGFDEESQFVSQYAIGTTEYRLRTSLNSYFFGFIDGGFGRHLLETDKTHNYIGTGLGLSLELKSSIINMALAIGRRDDAPFNLRQPKLHLGFASYF